MSFQQKRAALLAKNAEVLRSLSETAPMAPPVLPLLSAPSTPTKPKTPKKPRTPSSTTPSGTASPTAGTRSSSRIKDAIDNPRPKPTPYAQLTWASDDDDEDEDDFDGMTPRSQKIWSGTIGAPSRLSGYRPNPKIFGHQRGVSVGTSWASRMECSQAGIHAPPVGGIAGSTEGGAWSVALSGGYEDDIDTGYAFTYTGSGGRNLSGTKDQPKNLRTAPQTRDQEWTAMNLALKRSSETGKPIRVIRGFKGHSCFAPLDGYRYDGLYQVRSCWQDVGEAGFLVCRYAFVRMDGQPDIPIQPERAEEGDKLIAEFGKGSRATHSTTKSPSKNPIPSSPLKGVTPSKASPPKTETNTMETDSPSKKVSTPVKRTAETETETTTPAKKAKVATPGSRSSSRVQK